MEEEIDLREYIEVIFKRWYWIIGLSMLAAITAFVVTSFLEPTYEAEAKVIILKSRTEISLTSTFRTVENENENPAGSQETLVSLVESSDVAAAVLDQVGGLLGPESRNIISLLEKVKATNAADVISLKIADHDPQLAVELANAWASAYEAYVNDLFSQKRNSLLLEVQQQAQEVSQRYNAAQARWENFLRDNRIDVLEREIDLKKGRAEALKKQDLAILERELAIKKAQAQALRDLDASFERRPLFLLNLEQEILRETLQQKYDELKQMEIWLEDAQTMRDQLEKTTTSSSAKAGNALALMFLRSQVLASSAGQPVEVQASFSDIGDNSVSVADVTSLIEVIERRKARIVEEINALSTELLETQIDVILNPRSPTLRRQIAAMDEEILALAGTERWHPRSDALNKLVDNLDTTIQALQAELEQQTAKRRELRQARDLAWENLTTVQRKLAEVELASQITASQVRVAASAVEPNDPISPKRLLSTVIAAVLGVMVAVLGVFVVEYWQSEEQSQEEVELI